MSKTEKTDDEGVKVVTNAVALVIGLVLIVPLWLWQSFVLWKLWTWHAAPLTLALDFRTVAGLLVLRGAVRGVGRWQKETPTGVDGLAHSLAQAMVLLLALALGWFAAVAL